MPSAATPTATWTLRPGLAAGHYPERRDRETGWAERTLDLLWGRPGRFNANQRSGLYKIADAIGAQGEMLANLDHAGLNSRLLRLRRELRVQGLQKPLCLRAFALIREFAERTINLRHYDSQLMGGWVMLQGRLAEMETGEGKTLAATLAAATAALAGIPVHVLSVNDYLVDRDATDMGPLYRALGLTVGVVTQRMEPQARRSGYACDITYGTSRQVAFDYLRDRLTLGNDRSRLRLQLETAYAENHRQAQLLLRGLCFAIIDEADSVLIDEARTPLIMTRKVDSAAEHKTYCQALCIAKCLKNGRDFSIDSARGQVQLSRFAQQKLAGLKLTQLGLWQNARRREELVCRALHALHLLVKDRDYLVNADKVVIIDANTGRKLADRSWERGLHQMVEAKEGCTLTAAREQLGRLTYQRFFRRYLRLGGMTGTASEVALELWSVYGLCVQPIPLQRPSQRRELPARVYARIKDKWAAVIAATAALQKRGRPVLIGTGSVADSEMLSRQLTRAGIAHRVLNARQDKEEADIVATAGQLRQVTVATNMAGRGTDIPLAEGVAERGGLHVIATCLNASRRIDRQLSGRCGRQGDPGSHQVFLSREDALVRQNSRPGMFRFFSRLAMRAGLFHYKISLLTLRHAQREVERRHCRARRALLRHDRRTGRLLAFSGQLE